MQRPSHPTRPRRTPAEIERLSDASGAQLNDWGGEQAVDAMKSWDPKGLLAKQDWNVLRPLVAKTASDPAQAMARIRQYAGMLLSWNRSFSNLISKNDESRIVTRHLVESLQPAHWLASSGARRWMDLGSGGGLPAIPLLLAGVGESWDLVESRRTKTLFLRRVAQEMELGALEVVHSRLETVLEGGGDLRRYDGFTSRATLPLGPTLGLAASFVVKGGSAFLWKGSGHTEELESDPSWREGWTFEGVKQVGDSQNVVARFTRI